MKRVNNKMVMLSDSVKVCALILSAVILAGCVQSGSTVGGEPGWMNADEASLMNSQSNRFKMLGRDNIQFRTVGDGDSALVFKVVVDDLMRRTGMSLKELGLDLDKYQVLYADRGHETMLFFNIRRDSHDKIGGKDRDDEFINRITNYPYMEYWVDRRTWKVIAGTGLSF